MFAKPINLILVYIVTIFNIAILSCPLLALLVPFVNRHNYTIEIGDNILQKFQIAAFVLIFLVSFLMLIYFALDFIFGFAMRFSLSGCKSFDQIEGYDFIGKIFKDVKEKFDENSVKLYIRSSEEINAFAVSSLGGKVIVLTSGLIDHYLAESEDSEQFLSALRSVMAHEMSHLVNKDFLPAFLMIANQKTTNLISYILEIIFNLVTRIMSIIPYGGRFASRLTVDFYNITIFVLTFFNRFIVSNIYEFLRRFISRSIEYRCDFQSAQAFGGKNMAFALSFLGESGYFTFFSTHPATSKRIKMIENVDSIDEIIRPKFIDSVSNYFSIMFLVVLCLYFAKKGHIDFFIAEYIQNHETINRKLLSLWSLISKFL